jgi:hypothetical protein
MKERHLKLTVADLDPAYNGALPKGQEPRFYHFKDSIRASDFHESSLITYLDANGKQTIIKDIYSRIIK